MDNNPHQPTTQSARKGRFSRNLTLAAAGAIAISNPVAAQVRQSGPQVTPERAFETIWVVDRTMPELALWQTLVDVTSSDSFQPVVIHGADRDVWTESLLHLLEIVPDGRSVWVSDRGTAFDVDVVMDPVELRTGSGPAIVSAAAGLDDIAALIAMRLDGHLTTEPPTTPGPAVFVGFDPPQAVESSDVHLADRRAAVDYANQLAERSVVMVVREGGLRPEHVLYAFQRDAKILEVRVSSEFDILDPATEAAEVAAVRRQIHGSLPALVAGGMPEALVIAGGWNEIPFRYPGDNPHPCSGCDNGVYEYAADVAYANLDDDPWGEPEVPVGRLMSPEPDLLAIQTVIGIWREHGAFAQGTEGISLGLFGIGADHRRAMVDRWREAFPQQQWSAIGPDELDRSYRLDQEAFFHLADRAEFVVVHGHGSPDVISPNGELFNQAIAGVHLLGRRRSASPSFWFLHACATGKPDIEDWNGDQTLLVGLQSRLAYGSLMAVEDIAGGSADPFWWTDVVEPGLSVGELVRRFVAAGAVAYRDGGESAPGIPSTSGSPENKRLNALGALSWIGDPLTPVGDAE